MSKMIETLKNNGWEMSTLGQCQLGDEVLTRRDGKESVYTTVCGEYEREGFTVTEDGIFPDWTPVLRSPRPECAEFEPGTVALITWDEGYGPVRDLLPVRAMMSVEGVWHGAEIDPPGESDRVEVVRVLLPADQDTPPITDEMVERAAEDCYIASYEGPAFATQWDEVCEKYPDAEALYRRDARRILEAALGEEKEK